MQFKVGDIIKGTIDGRYTVTNENMYAAKVVELCKSGNIRIKILDHFFKDYVGDIYTVDPKYFVYKDNYYSIVEIIEAPYGAKEANGSYGILIDFKTADKIFKEEKFCHQGLGKNSDYFFIPFNSNFYDTQHYSGEIWGFGKDFTEIEFKDITTGMIYNKKPKKMTIEEIKRELGYEIEIVKEK